MDSKQDEKPVFPANSPTSTSTASTEDVERPPPVKRADDVPPDGGYGWVNIACNFFINGNTWGVNSTYGVFLAYYLSHNYFPNTSALVYAFIGGVSMSMAMLIAPLATMSVRVLGTRYSLYIGVFFETGSLIGASFARQKWQLILSQGVCFGIGMGFLFVASVGVPAQWFLKKRSIANAIAAAGSGLGGLIWSLAAQAMITRLGLPWAFRIIGICTGVANFICSSIIRDRNKQAGSRYRSFDWAILRRPEFLLIQAWSWFSMLGYVIVLFSIASYARAIGLTAGQGSIVSALLSLGQMLGRPFIGLSSDRWGRINLAAFYTFLCGIFCFIFWVPAELAPSRMGLLTFFAIVGGALAGTFWTTIAPVAAEVVGLRDLPSALSWTWLIMVPAVTCAEPIALELRRHQVVHFIYLYAQIFAGCCYIAGGVCMWILRGWKIGELEEAERLEAKMQARTRTITISDDEKHENVKLDNELTREVSAASTRKQGWRMKDLWRRMLVAKVV